MRTALSFLVLPMCSHTLFGDEVHLFRANLHFEWLALRSDDRGVQRLVKIIARSRNPVFEPAGHWFPRVVNYAQGRVAMTNLVRSNDPRRYQIVNLIDIDLLRV